MLYPTTEYAYVDENGQSVAPSNFIQHVYNDNNEQTSPQMMFDGNNFDDHQQQTQYRPMVIDGSQPL